MPTTINWKEGVLGALAGIGVMATFVWTFWFQKGMLGYQSYAKDSVQFIAVRTTPIALISSFVGIGVLVVLMRRELRVGDSKISPLWRRYAALVIDFWFLIFVLANIIATIALLLEAQRNHSFQWHFEREYSVLYDWAVSALILAGMGAMAAYFVLPLANRRQTLGYWA
jgi:hypothetical protein